MGKKRETTRSRSKLNFKGWLEKKSESAERKVQKSHRYIKTL